jgi:GDPmannose 4,6-dehydratase
MTGIGGQDGSYLAELLLSKGYDVVGTVLTPPDEVRDGAELFQLDLDDGDAVAEAIRKFEPDEIYHLASVSFVPASWEDPAEQRGR